MRGRSGGGGGGDKKFAVFSIVGKLSAEFFFYECRAGCKNVLSVSTMPLFREFFLLQILQANSHTGSYSTVLYNSSYFLRSGVVFIKTHIRENTGFSRYPSNQHENQELLRTISSRFKYFLWQIEPTVLKCIIRKRFQNF